MAGMVIEQRQQVLDAAYARNPNASPRPTKHPPSPQRSGSTTNTTSSKEELASS